MIPKSMEAFLKKALPERTWQNRLNCEAGLCYMEFSGVDIERLSRLGITVDQLGPKLVSCIWDEEPSIEVGGYLVVDNLAMGRPAMGGIRMLSNLTPAEIFYRARGMTLKNAAANLPYGGGKAGLVADPHVDAKTRQEVICRFARLLVRYRDIFLPGPDVGTDTQDMKLVAVQNGLDLALSKPEGMGGNQLDMLGAAGGGLVVAIETLLKELHRLRTLPQFADLTLPEPDQLTVLIQGFGSVGANAAHLLLEKFPYARITGVSDTSGYLFDEMGLPVDKLYNMWKEKKQICYHFFTENITPGIYNRPKYGSNGNDLLRETAFCILPAAPKANYLDTEESSQPLNHC
jgi:glutamate dehydrogenase/leucine dehydrogenase